jgi:hypothetical protein
MPLCNRHGFPFAAVGWVSLLVAFANAQPGPSYVHCLDTMAINSAEVFVVTIAELCTPGDCIQKNNVIVSIEQRLKGDEVDQSDKYQFRIDAPSATLADWKERRSQLLVYERSERSCPRH